MEKIENVDYTVRIYCPYCAKFDGEYMELEWEDYENDLAHCKYCGKNWKIYVREDKPDE